MTKINTDFLTLLLLKSFQEKMGFRGSLTARLRKRGEKEWKKVWEMPVPNKIVNVGIAQAMKCLGDGATAVFGWGTVGTGTDAPLATDTQLQTEVDRQAVAFSQETTVITNDTNKWVTTHTAPVGGWSITEYAVVNAAAAGIIYNRVVFAAIALDEDDQLEFSYKVQGKESV